MVVARMLSSIFYEIVLPNTAAGALFIVFILLFRTVTRRLSKGYVRMLWILLLIELLIPPMFHGSVYTIRNLALNVWDVPDGQRAAADIEQSGADLYRQQDDMLSENGSAVNAGLKSAENNPDGDLSADGMETQTDSVSTQTNSEVMAHKQNGIFSNMKRLQSNLEGLMNRMIPNWFKDSNGLYSNRLYSNRMIFAGIWLAGFLGICAVYLGQFIKLNRRVSDAVYVKKDRCWETENIDMPFVMPRLRPRVYLPYGLAGSKRKDIMSHEMQHIKNLDPLIKCAAAFAAAVHWFNPFVWTAYVLIGKDLEMYCDECVLKGRSLKERRDYTNTLLESAAESSGLTLMMHFGESNTEKRIRHILFVKKPRVIVSVLLFAIISVSGLFFLTSQNTQGKETQQYLEQDTQEILAEKIQSQTKEPMLKQFYEDYDGDGIHEMFAVTGAEPAQGPSQIWFASAGEDAVCLMDSEDDMVFNDDGGICEIDSGRKLFLINCGTTGSVYFSKCYYVQSNRVHEVQTGENLLEHDQGADFKVFVDAYDRMSIDGSMSGHTRKAYYLKWTGSGFEEYPAEKISIDELRRYDGAEDVLRQISELDYEVSDIYLRGNGIINVNVVQDFDAGTIYENITLKAEKDAVSVVEILSGEKELISSSSYGGIYYQSGFLDMAKDSGGEASADSENSSGGEAGAGSEAGLGSEKTDSENGTGTGSKAGTDREGGKIDQQVLFAEKIIRLVRQGKKELLADLIRYPIRAYVGNKEYNLKNADEFVQNYDQIANEGWKARLLTANSDEVMSNYMGYSIADGAVWFEISEGEEGKIFAINNGQGSVKAEEKSVQEAWQELAAQHGMTLEEARVWYSRFLEDELYVDIYNYKITGCAYDDFDQNGTKDLFIVTSLSPHEIYPEPLNRTAYVYGYMNGTLVYAKGMAEFSANGFLQCDAHQGEDGNVCMIQYTVDTGSLNETMYLLDVDQSGSVTETALSSQMKDAQALKSVMADFYQAYFEGNEAAIRGHLAQSYDDRIDVYGRLEDADRIQFQGVKETGLAAGEADEDQCTLALEFLEPGEDSYTYLTVGFVREDEIWKVDFYGLEK